MKKLIYFTFILFSGVATAQIKDVVLSKPIKISAVDLYKQREPNIIYANDSFVYAVITRDDSKAFNIKPEKHTLVKYDARTLEIISEINVPFAFHYVFGDTLAYSIRYNEVQFFSKYNLRTQDSVSYIPKFDKVEESETAIRMTGDKKAIYAINYYRNSEGNIQVSYKVLGLDFKILHERDFSMPYYANKHMEERLYFNQIRIDSDYNIYFGLWVRNPKEWGYKSVHHYEVIKYTLASGKLSKYDTDIGSELYSVCTFFATDDQTKRLRVFGTYSINYGECIGGFYVTEFDMVTAQKIDFRKIPFTPELVQSVRKTGLYKSKDNELCYAGCPSFFHTISTDDNRLFYLSLFSEASERMGQLFISLDNNWNIKWTSFNYMEQKLTQIPYIQLKANVSVLSDSSICFYFNDRTTKDRNSEFQKYAKSKILDTHIPFIAKVNKENGGIERFPLIPLAEKGLILHITSVENFSGKVLYAIAANKKQEQFLVKIVMG